MNVSLTPSQEQFVRGQVTSGRYRSASEVLRDGLRMLEEAEHRRLVEKWILETITPEEEALLPPELKNRAKAYFTKLVEDGIRSGDEEGWLDGPEALDRISDNLRQRAQREP